MTVTPEAPPETHAGRTTLEVAITARTMQLAIRARLLRDVTALWPALDKDRLGETFPGWVRAMSLLVRNYHGQSAAAASAAYREARAQATMSPAPRSLVKLAPAPSDEWMARAFGFSGPGMLQRDTVRPNTALSVTMGTASRIVLDGGRTTTIETVKADPVALGWYRLTDGDPCAFCAMLAARGAVYKDDSFKESNAKFTGVGEFKVHNHCGCNIAPVFTRKQSDIPEQNRAWAKEWQEVTKGLGGADARLAWRQHIEGRDVTAKPGSSNAKRGGGNAARPTHDPIRDVDAGRTVEQLKSTLAALEKSSMKFESAGTRKRIEELRRKIAERS